MSNLLSFTDAVFDAYIETNSYSKTLLIGNGFSIDYLKYDDLFRAYTANYSNNKKIIDLFKRLGTTDFEKVLRSLDEACIVAQAYGNCPHANEIKRDAQALREALIETIRYTHPSHKEYLENNSEKHLKLIRHFSKIFTLNYDLLLYWLRMNSQNQTMSDGFGLGSQERPYLHGPFRQDAHCRIHNLHGGLHIFENAHGEVYKVKSTEGSLIENLSHLICTEKKFPLYVAEGTSMQKLKKIMSSAYLSDGYYKLLFNIDPIFIYGHSAADNDKHIYSAIFRRSSTPCVYFGVYDKDQKNEIEGKLSFYQKRWQSDTKYKLFDSTTIC